MGKFKKSWEAISHVDTVCSVGSFILNKLGLSMSTIGGALSGLFAGYQGLPLSVSIPIALGVFTFILMIYSFIENKRNKSKKPEKVPETNNTESERPVNPNAYMPVFDLITYIAHESEHGESYTINEWMIAVPYDIAKAAELGRITIRGRRSDNNQFEDVDSEYWINCGLDVDGCLKSEKTCRTEQKNIRMDTPPVIYYDLKVKESEVVKEWPRKDEQET